MRGPMRFAKTEERAQEKPRAPMNHQPLQRSTPAPIPAAATAADPVKAAKRTLPPAAGRGAGRPAHARSDAGSTAARILPPRTARSSRRSTRPRSSSTAPCRGSTVARSAGSASQRARVSSPARVRAVPRRSMRDPLPARSRSAAKGWSGGKRSARTQPSPVHASSRRRSPRSKWAMARSARSRRAMARACRTMRDTNPRSAAPARTAGPSRTKAHQAAARRATKTASRDCANRSSRRSRSARSARSAPRRSS